MSWFLTNIIATILLPPLSLLLVFFSGLLLWHKHPRTARTLLSSAFILLWLVSTPFLAEALLHRLENTSSLINTKEKFNSAQAIVVLGGGSYFHAPEYAGDTVSTTSLERLRYAAKLYREQGQPILLTGGSPRGSTSSEAELMKHVLELEFNAPVKWVEELSNNTLESAFHSYTLLQPSNIKRIFLVTHAWHMPRSILAFQRAGFEVIPAPIAFTTRYELDLLAFLPNANALRDSQIYLHEVMGLLWYRLKS